MSISKQTIWYWPASTSSTSCAMWSSQYCLDFSLYTFTCFPLSEFESVAYVFHSDRVDRDLFLLLVRLVRHIMYNGCERDHDLFSSATDSLVNILPKSYRGRCPLTRLGAFGLTKFHDIRLCDQTHTHENTGLLNHFVVYHYLSYPWANKLCNAMQAGDSDGSKQILFKPNEPIKAEKWLTNQGKLLVAKCLSSTKKKRRRTTKTKVKK